MREKADHWEYIGTYVDDLAITSKDPRAIVDKLVKEYKFKLKGTGPISYHLGCDFIRDEDKVLCIQPRKYIERMVETYVRLFGEKLKELYSSPLKKGDHPELDTSDLLDADGIQKYQSMIGAMQWAISIGRFDIATAIMSLSSFRVTPRVGHLERCKRIYAYLSKMRHAAIQVRTDEPNFSALPDITYDWAQSVYGNVKEVIPKDYLKLLGKHVTLSHYVDSCIMTCFQDVQLPGFSTSSTSVPLIGTPRNRVQSRRRHLGLRRMPQGLLRSKSSTCVALSATWEFR